MRLGIRIQSPIPNPRFPVRVLLGPIADVAARRAGARAEIAGAAGLRAETAGDTLRDVARARVLRTVVPRTAFHRSDIFGAHTLVHWLEAGAPTDLPEIVAD